jgi:hypothetical protein
VCILGFETYSCDRVEDHGGTGVFPPLSIRFSIVVHVVFPRAEYHPSGGFLSTHPLFDEKNTVECRKDEFGRVEKVRFAVEGRSRGRRKGGRRRETGSSHYSVYVSTTFWTHAYSRSQSLRGRNGDETSSSYVLCRRSSSYPSTANASGAKYAIPYDLSTSRMDASSRVSISTSSGKIVPSSYSKVPRTTET